MIQYAPDCLKRKEQGQKISMITCYDYTSACIIEQTQIDMILVGDSAAMVMHGFPNTTHATLDMMVLHTSAVARAIKSKLIVADLPFLSYRHSLSHTMKAVQRLIQAGAGAVKLEGVEGNLDTILHIVESGVPVMGHIGLVPQSIWSLGGFRVQGKKSEQQRILMEEAKALEEAGCFAIVLECLPQMLAKNISQSIHIPTIGIGAGPHTDGQILVFQDALGLQSAFQPKFLKHYCQGESVFIESLNCFVQEVQKNAYPSSEHTYEAH